MLEILPPFNEEDKFIAAVSYPFWFVVSWLVLLSEKKREPFLFCHAWTSLFLGLFFTAAMLVVVIITTVFFRLTSPLASPSTAILMVIAIIFLIILAMAEFGILFYLAYIASLGKMVKIPYIYEYVERLYIKTFQQNQKAELPPKKWTDLS